MPEALDRIAELDDARRRPDPGRRRDRRGERRGGPGGRCISARRGERRLRRCRAGRGVPAARSPPLHEPRARARARRGARAGTGIRTRPSAPSSSRRTGTVVGEGVSEPAGGRHAEIVALERRRGARAGRDALRDDGAVRAPRPHAAVRRRHRRRRRRAGRGGLRRPEPGGRWRRRRTPRGRRRRRAARPPRGAARRTRRGGRGSSRGRPYVVLKMAVSLDGRAVVPGRRWVTGEEARRRVHRLRAEVDAVAVGMGTVRADAPRLDARDVGAIRQPRRLAFGRGPLPEGSELELRSGPLAEELASLAAEGRPVAPPRGRADDRCVVPRRRPRRPARRPRRAGARGGRPADGRAAARADRPSRADGRARRRRRAARHPAARRLTPSRR